MRKIIHGIKHSTFLRHNLIFLAGSVAVGGLNYLFYPVIGRLLEPSSFGEVQVLISLFLQLTIFLTVMSLVTVNLTANQKNKTTLNELIYELEKVGLIVSLFVLAITVVFGGPIKQLLNFDSSLPFVLLAIALVVTVPFTFRSAYLRGQQLFGKTSLANLISAGGKLGFSATLVIMGFGTNGAIIGLFLAQLVAFAYARWEAQRTGLERTNSSPWSLPKLQLIKPELHYSMFVFVGSLSVIILFSVDVIIVKTFFDAHTAGLYAGIATIARMVFFVTASIVQVMLPAVKIHQSTQKNQQLLMKSMFLLCVISSPILLLFIGFPEFTTNLLMGSNYQPYAELLPQLGLAIFIISVLNLLISYYLALRQYIPSLIAMIGTIIVTTLMIQYHDSLSTLVATLLYGTIGIVCLIPVWAFIKRLMGGLRDSKIDINSSTNT